MSGILIVRDNTFKTGDKALLEHQAIIGITRSILANYSRETRGMSVSEHRILVPAHLDILPLLTHVADDYTELVEPEPEKVNKTAPFVLYWDESSEQKNDEDLIRIFLHPRWFGLNRERNSLQNILYTYNPQVCVLLGDARETIERLLKLKYSFKHLITFSSLMPNDVEEYSLSFIIDQITVADQRFQEAVTSSIRNLDIPPTERFEFWYSMYGREEGLADLEPFVAFGAAFEMAMFIDKRSF